MVWITCGECAFGDENQLTMVQHVLEAHPSYTPEEAAHYVSVWQEDSYDQEEIDNIERAEYYRLHGVDMDDVDRDPL